MGFHYDTKSKKTAFNPWCLPGFNAPQSPPDSPGSCAAMAWKLAFIDGKDGLIGMIDDHMKIIRKWDDHVTMFLVNTWIFIDFPHCSLTILIPQPLAGAWSKFSLHNNQKEDTLAIANHLGGTPILCPPNLTKWMKIPQSSTDTWAFHLKNMRFIIPHLGDEKKDTDQI